MDLIRRAWLLNLDAEAELDDPSAHTPSRATAARTRDLAGRLEGLIPEGDVLVWPGDRLPEGRFRGRAWCPTPRALAELARAGAEPEPAPPLAVLRRVNHRRFCADLGSVLPGARYVTTRAELAEALALPSPTGAHLLKRPLGFVGRGRLRLEGAIDAIDAAAERWIAAALSRGEGLQVEPLVERAGDFALHGHLSAEGELTAGEPTVQRCDARGAWLGSEPAAPGELSESERAALDAALDATAEALREAGYFGPFGIDAFRYHAAGGLAFQPRCEINARYSMGWAVGMGARRPDL